MNYAIFRSELVYTFQYLAQIGLHNKREKQAYKSNPDTTKENELFNYIGYNKFYEKE